METISIGSEAGRWLALIFFFALSVAIGFAVFSLLSRPETRRAEFLRFGAASRKVSAIVGTLLGVAVFSTLAYSMFSGFYRMEAHGETVRLRYLIPPHTADVRRDHLARLDKVPAYGVSWRLVVTTGKGEKYESAAAGARTIEEARRRLAQLAAE
jgi:hypothetical protein